jgi:hypothetical protein
MVHIIIKELENKSPATRHYWHLWDAIEIREGLLLKKFHRKDGIEVYTQLLVPFEIKNEVLKNMHNSVMSGHLGDLLLFLWHPKDANNDG